MPRVAALAGVAALLIGADARALVPPMNPVAGPPRAQVVLVKVTSRRPALTRLLGTELLRQLGAAQACYEHELERQWGLEGDLDVTAALTPQGRLADLHVPLTVSELDALRECVQAAVSQWTFELHPEVAEPVSWRFVFTRETSRDR